MSSSVEENILRVAPDDSHRLCHPAQAERTAGSVRQTLKQMSALLGDMREARELLALMHEQPLHWTSLGGDEVLSADQVAGALMAAKKRSKGAPLQYAAGKAAFRNLMLVVDERALIPRPETEVLVELVLDAMRGIAGATCVDVGTGSGAIAISLAVEGNFSNVIATDVSHDALDVARCNAQASGVTNIEFRQGSLLAPLAGSVVQAVVSNPPYIAYEEASVLPASVRDWEPAVALYSPDNGMSLTRELVRQAATVLASSGLLAMEVDVRRASLVAECVASHGAYGDIRVLKDLTGRERFVTARKQEDVAA